MIKGVIFDLDGVLLDSMYIWKDLGIRYLQRQRKAPEEGLSEILFSMSMEQGAAYLNSHYKLGVTDTEVLEGIQDMLRDFYFYEVKAKPGARELMERFKADGVKMIAATSSPREHVTKALIRNGLYEFLEDVLTTSELNTSKHEPDIYYLAAEKMCIGVDEGLVFEDSLYAIKTAKAAGFKVAGVYDEYGEANQAGVEESADYYIKNLSEY